MKEIWPIVDPFTKPHPDIPEEYYNEPEDDED